MKPLVSIITRTLGRATIAETAASVAAQTYRPLEWVVVDAGGKGVAVPPAGDVPTRVVGTGGKLLKGAAANVGIDAAHGRYVTLLDDDDLIRPLHVENLQQVIASSPGARAAHADMELQVELGAPSKFLASVFSPLKLCSQNLFAPVAVMFDVSLVRDDGCRFDDDIVTFEDWDMWLKLAAHTTFVRSPSPTAVYRMYLGLSGADKIGTPDADPAVTADHAMVMERYRERRERLEREQADRRAAARAAETRRDLPAATEGWRIAAVADPWDLEALGKYAQFAFLAGEPAAASVALERLAMLVPDKGEVHWNLALVLDALGERDRAATVRARAIELVPAFAQRPLPA